MSDLRLMKEKEPTLKNAVQIVLNVAEKYGLKILSIILYGSKARGDYSFDSDYDFFILFDNDTSLLQYTQFVSELRLALSRLEKVNLYSNTVENFRHIMVNNPFLGSFCYIIAAEGIPLHDPQGIFKKLSDEVSKLPIREKIRYVKKCVTMSKILGSPRWISYWKEKLKTLETNRYLE